MKIKQMDSEYYDFEKAFAYGLIFRARALLSCEIRVH